MAILKGKVVTTGSNTDFATVAASTPIMVTNVGRAAAEVKNFSKSFSIQPGSSRFWLAVQGDIVMVNAGSIEFEIAVPG